MDETITYETITCMAAGTTTGALLLIVSLVGKALGPSEALHFLLILLLGKP